MILVAQDHQVDQRHQVSQVDLLNQLVQYLLWVQKVQLDQENQQILDHHVCQVNPVVLKVRWGQEVQRHLVLQADQKVQAVLLAQPVLMDQQVLHFQVHQDHQAIHLVLESQTVQADLGNLVVQCHQQVLEPQVGLYYQ